MNNVEFNHYHNLKLCDSHWHLSMPHALQDTVRTFREMMAYFVLDRVGLMTLVNTSNRYDPAANLKAFYIKDVLNHEKADSVFAYGCLNQTYDARDTEEGFLTQVKTLCTISE
ncbi:MAG: hypothetical protein IJC78_04875 [Clostridia bacterium]|nr:hypothetical protein [Clostridia bacterium]